MMTVLVINNLVGTPPLSVSQSQLTHTPILVPKVKDLKKVSYVLCLESPFSVKRARFVLLPVMVLLF